MAIFAGSFLTGYFTPHVLDMLKSESQRLAEKCMNRLNKEEACDDDEDKDDEDD